MFEITIDMSSFDEMVGQLGKWTDQLPYALSQALNDAAFKTRQVLTQSTWPRAVEVHNANFISAALRVEKATKQSLEIRIYDALHRGNLALHAEGGRKVPFRAQHLAIPVPGWARRTAHGVGKGQRPTDIIANTPKRALRITDRGIFVGQGGRLHLRYSLVPSAEQPKDVLFREDFEYTMNNAMRTGFEDILNRAIGYSMIKQQARQG